MAPPNKVSYLRLVSDNNTPAPTSRPPVAEYAYLRVQVVMGDDGKVKDAYLYANGAEGTPQLQLQLAAIKAVEELLTIPGTRCELFNRRDDDGPGVIPDTIHLSRR